MGAVLAAFAGTARAEWMRGETKHFVVYEDADAAEIRRVATELERFDGFIRLFHERADVSGAESNKLTVYVVPDVGAVQELFGDKSRGVYGFYAGRASGAVAFTPRRVVGQDKWTLNPRIVLFHEYAHHFLLGNFVSAYPAWFSEGYAEFVSTMIIGAEKVTIGSAANHRAYSLFAGTSMPARLLFDPAARKRLSAAQIDAVYARGWLLTHWIMFEPARREQLGRYFRALNDGTPSLKAATDAFGDLDALDKQLNRYVRGATLPGIVMKTDEVPQPDVTVTALSPGARAMIEYRLVSTRGVDAKTAPALYRRAASAAARFPDDPVAQGWFAEIAADAREDAAAGAAADRALARDPRSIQALIYKGMLAMRVADKSGRPADWEVARGFFIRANRIDPDKAQPLMLFYASFEAEKRPPKPSAVAGLYRAQELVPQDPALRVLAARQLIRENKLADGRRMLAPLAYNPHLPADNYAARAITALDAKDSAAALAALSGERGQDAEAPPLAPHEPAAPPKPQSAG